MIKKNQPIELTIVRGNLRDYYISKGYKCKIRNFIKGDDFYKELEVK